MKKKRKTTKSRLPKLPKAPRAKASLKVWKAYAKKVHEHQKVVAEIKHARKILCSPSFAFPAAPIKPSVPRHKRKTHVENMREMGLPDFTPRKKTYSQKLRELGLAPPAKKKKKKIPAGMYGSPHEWHRKMLAAKKRKAAMRAIQHRGMYAGMR